MVTLIGYLCKLKENWLHTTTKHCFTPKTPQKSYVSFESWCMFVRRCHFICVCFCFGPTVFNKLTLLSPQSWQSCPSSVWMCRATAYPTCLCATDICGTSKASSLTTTPSRCPLPKYVPKESSTSLNIWTWRPAKGLRTSLRKLCGPPPSTAGETSRMRGLRVLKSFNRLFQWKHASDNVCGLCSLDQDLFPGQYGGLDSGFNSVDSGSKRWSGNEV